MSEDNQEIPHLRTVRHAEVTFYDQTIPASLGNDLIIYVPVRHICEVLGIDTQNQMEHILNHQLLRQALARLDFPTRYLQSKRMTEMNAISIKRLHSWLMTISPERIENPDIRQRLYHMQEELADVIYAWMAREGVPEDIRAEEEQNLPEGKRTLYEAIAEAHDAVNLVELAHSRIDEIDDRLKTLETQWNQTGVEHINKQQQAQYRTWVKLIGDQLVRRGDGNYGDVEADLKRQFNFISYKWIEPKDFEEIRQYCIQWYKRLVPPGAPLPPAFTDPSQQRLF